MSREPVDVVRAMYDAFNRGDTDAILELADPAVSVEDHAVIDGATYEGREGVIRFLAFQAEAFNAQSAELEELIETGDDIVAVIPPARRGTAQSGSARGAIQPRVADRRRNGPSPACVREQAGSPGSRPLVRAGKVARPSRRRDTRSRAFD